MSDDLTILDAVRDPNLFRPFFEPLESWHAWFAALAAIFALPMDTTQQRIFKRHTGRTTIPSTQAREGWFAVGRRGGKDRIMALIVVFLSCFRGYASVLAPGERGIAMLLAADRRQARVAFGYIRALLEGVPMLARMIESTTKEAIHLTNGITIEVHTASFRAVRGYTVIVLVVDEIGFWYAEDSANPDAEVIAALRPGMSTVPGALLLAISSPYSRRGELWENYKRHFGQDGDPVLFWQAPTLAMNPTFPEHVIKQAYEDDEARASAEYGAEFRRDIESFVAREAVDAVVVPERRELPPMAEASYSAFCDPSGGSSDSMTLAVAHREKEIVVIDAIRERRPPFSPDQVVAEFAETLRSYRVYRISGDRYAGAWVPERFREHGIEYRPAERTKSELYGELLPAINGQRIELLDHPRLIAQLCSLERRTSRGGRDSIDHPPRGRDDVVNVVAGAAHLLRTKKPRLVRVR